jgi:hypothetical protein
MLNNAAPQMHDITSKTYGDMQAFLVVRYG